MDHFSTGAINATTAHASLLICGKGLSSDEVLDQIDLNAILTDDDLVQISL